MELKIGTVLSRLISERRVTLREISQATGISISTINEWQSNRKPKDPEQVLKLARYFSVSMHYLLFGEEDKHDAIRKVIKEEFLNGTFEISIKRISSTVEKN